MAIDLNGILNVNEYYTNHYLNTIFEDNIKDVLNKWRNEAEEKDVKTPWSKIRELRKKYFNKKESFLTKKNYDELFIIQRDFVIDFLKALGYNIEESILPTKDNLLIPVLSEIKKSNGSTLLWIIESCDFENKEDDILSSHIVENQYSDEECPVEIENYDMENIISKFIFSMENPPRWIILIKFDQLLLIDRNKWAEKSLISFDFDEIFSRNIESTYHAVSILLNKESTCPEDGTAILDTFNESSHKHASAVSEDLKYSLRRCIELLGNEAAKYMIEKKRRTYNRQLADKLTIECIRYMYRILFVLFIESRPELGYAPMKSEEYVNGYSIENLRDIVDNTKLDTNEAQDGYFIDESLKKMFKMIYEGYPVKNENNITGQIQMNPDEYISKNMFNTFRIEPLKAHLFDPDRLKLLNKVKFKNKVLYEVIKEMSISKNRKSKKKRPGRISYSQLGINQLGAVYESLLSYRGFFAEEELYEVKKAGENTDELDIGYFVPEHKLSDYSEDERVRNKDGSLKKHEKGAFIYRLAGRERIKSASYYTPEVLTKCLVKYSLKELLKDKKADDILELKICEPAMGSAAFLNEAINQLAESYLRLKQKELGKIIDHNEYIIEKQKVKIFIADRNIYGIDLNPIAVELAEVSLWLNTIYKGAYVPWFGTQLICGNSLIGARRQVYNESKLIKGLKKDELWFSHAPERVKPADERKSDEIYHFLLSDPGMSNYDDKVIKSLAPDNIKEIREWKSEFIKAYSEDEIEILKGLSSTIDDLWDKHFEIKKKINGMLTDPMSIFGHREDEKNVLIRTTKEKDKIFEEEYLSEGMRNSGPYARLKFAMDYWCALWFWPIQKSHLLPSRSEFIFEIQTILEGSIIPIKEEGQISLFEKPEQQLLDLYGETGQVNLDMLCENSERLKLVKGIAKKYRFLHWELEFVDVFKDRGGFDFILGNPPWLKLTWEEKEILGDIEPKLVIKKFSATDTMNIRNSIIDINKNIKMYFNEFVEFDSYQKFLNANQNYFELTGGQSNLYKCFIPQALNFTNTKGVFSYIHPEGVYDDSKGEILRQIIYSKLSLHFQFENVKGLFNKVDNDRKFSINIYNNNNISSFSFISISNLFDPITVDECFEKNKKCVLSGIKNNDGNWNTRGHNDRIIKITKRELKIFNDVFDKSKSDFSKTKYPIIHSVQVLKVIEKFINEACKKLYEYKSDYFATECWHESNAQKRGIIERKVSFPKKSNDLILSGSHIGHANPLFKTSRFECKTNSDFDEIDIYRVSKANFNYQRTNYEPKNLVEFDNKIPKTSWNKKINNLYKLSSRKMMKLIGERSLISAITPKECSHINGLISLVFKDHLALCKVAGYFCSIPYDFFIRTLGKGNLYDDSLKTLPIPETSFDNYVILRALMLNCLTESYVELWSYCWKNSFVQDSWAKNDLRLNINKFKLLRNNWNSEFPLRSDYERRQALIEIDVLTSMALGLELEDLKTIYRIQFPVLKNYEDTTWYDRYGRIIYTSSKRLKNTKLDRKKWKEVKEMKTGTVEKTFEDDTMPGGPIERTIVYEAPFDKCDREEDYEIVWKNFEKRWEGAANDTERSMQSV